MIIDEDDYLEHYGTPRHSGRYPWGSGGNEGTPRNASFLDIVKDLRRQGLTDAEIAKGMNLSSTDFRAKNSIERNERKQSQISMAERLRVKGLSNGAIAQRMNLPGESSVRALLAPGEKERAEHLTKIMNMLKGQVEQHQFVDIGSGVESHVKIGTGVDAKIGVSKEKLNTAVFGLREQGYNVHLVKIPTDRNRETEMKVLVSPGVTQREAWENRFNVKQITKFSSDGGRTYGSIHPPISVHPDRVAIKYGSEGGSAADGVIFVRPGVEDIHLGKSNYAQVRVLVGDGHYLKGMAMYKDDLPKGVDLLFNTKKEDSGNKIDAMKPIEPNKDFPFGSIVRQITENTDTKDERVTSAMNLVYEEGQWGEWSKTLSSQFLSKQAPPLAKEQLKITYDRRVKDFNEINALTNPVVKKKLLEDFAGDTDSASVHLQSASFPRSQWHAILPVESLKTTEVYAPNYTNGDHVVLIRYPHGGKFEIPELVVNNRNPEARRNLKNAQDAIGIHPSTAQVLSGADFDGDTVLLIPNTDHKIKGELPLEGLKDFDPQHEFPGYDGMSKINKQTEMGKISNLITDMTLKGAPHEHLVRAVRHSMVVIDAEKHNLNYKESERVNGIRDLSLEYQGKSTGGASTLISRKKKDITINERKARRQSKGGPIDPDTGRKIFEPTGNTRINKEGVRVPKTMEVSLLGETEDAHTLSSGTPIEKLYADHSNRLKDLANQARLTASRTPRMKRSRSAAKVYEKEVSSLDAKLNDVIANRPRERQARVISNASIKQKLTANPHLSKDSKKKLRTAELIRARTHMGVRSKKIEFTRDEWDAVQAGAISENKLSQLLQKANMEEVRKLATPRHVVLMTPTQTSRATALLRSGATRAEVARVLGVSLTTLDRATTGQTS